MMSSDFVLLCLFFFKQKTAYEMRISDWSSDVCSSDLFETGIPGEHEARATANKSVKSPTPRAETFENPVGYVKEDCIGLHRVGKADTGKTFDRRSEARSTAVCTPGIAQPGAAFALAGPRRRQEAPFREHGSAPGRDKGCYNGWATGG